jgi:hypothetical protein
MQTLVRMKFGSHLYGTATPQSDLDIKAVHLPRPADILLQRVKGVVSTKTKADERAKNTADDVDFETFALQRYLELAADGQTVALDMLFAPDFAMMEEPSPLWREVQANRHRLLTRRYASFMGYCRAQANKYGIKGSRVAASRKALGMLAGGLECFGTTARLSELTEEIEAATPATEHMSIFDQTLLNGAVVRHWEVCGRKMPYTATIKSAHAIMKRLVDEYGARALAAEQQQGVDWKAVSHAVRIGRQAIEVLTVGYVEFPRRDAAHLLAIKTGQLPFKQVSEEIDQLLVEMEAAALASELPEAADHAWIDAFVADAYGQIVRRAA